MTEETVHEVRVHLTREKPPIRKATLEMTGEEVTFGTPGWQGEHYGFAPEVVEGHPPGTLDYLVASVAGCLIGTFGGALRVRDIPNTGGALTADALGEVVVDPDKVLRLRKITVTYRLRAPESKRAAAERALAHHAHHCPNARSVAGAIEVVTEMDFVPADEPASAPA